MKNPWVAGSIAFVVILMLGVLTSPELYECVAEHSNNHGKDGSQPHPNYLLVGMLCSFKALHSSHGFLTFIATVFLVGFTGRLWWSTDKLASITSDLHSMAQKQEETSKKQTRAYLTCGGVFGVPKDEDMNIGQRYRPKASEYEPEWRMAIYNFGKTPGYITQIRWCICPEGQFPRDELVSDLIEKKRFVFTSPRHVQDVVAPTGDRPLHYRQVSFQERAVGHVFFGRIDYVDVFGDTHHSTFALLHDAEHTDTIGESYSRDKS